MLDDKFGFAPDCELASFNEVCEWYRCSRPVGCKLQGFVRAVRYGPDSFRAVFGFYAVKK